MQLHTLALSNGTTVIWELDVRDRMVKQISNFKKYIFSYHVFLSLYENRKKSVKQMYMSGDHNAKGYSEESHCKTHTFVDKNNFS